MKCLQCKTENLEGAKCCKKCGQSLLTETVCSQCGPLNSLDSDFCIECGHSLAEPAPSTPAKTKPTSFASGRYQVKKLLGEGGKKKVYLTHDSVLDRDVAFAMSGGDVEALNEKVYIYRLQIKEELPSSKDYIHSLLHYMNSASSNLLSLS